MNEASKRSGQKERGEEFLGSSGSKRRHGSTGFTGYSPPERCLRTMSSELRCTISLGLRFPNMAPVTMTSEVLG